MQFPMTDNMTPEQVATNNSAQKSLIRGKYYSFEPPVEATAVPVAGSNVCTLQECKFDRGWYIGLIRENHVFQGRPVNDQRTILEQFRESFFHVVFVGGSRVTLDPEQGN